MLLVTPGAKAAGIAGVVFGPFVWLSALLIEFALVPLTCSGDGHMALHLTTAVALGFVMAGAVLAWRTWQLAGASDSRESASVKDRNRLLGILGMSSSGFAIVALIGLEIGNWMVHPCR